MYSSIDEFLWPNRLILIYSGFWPMKPNIHVVLRYWNNLRIVSHIVFAVCLVLPQVFEIIDKWGNLEILTETGCLALLLGLLAFKQCYIMGRHNQFEKMYWLLRDLWKLSKNRKEANALESCAWQGKFCTALFWITGCSTYLLYVAAPVYVWTINYRKSNGSDYERHLLLNCRYWFNPSLTPIFEMTFTWEAFALYSSGHCVVGLDGSMMTMIMHVVAQFRLINVRLTGIGCTLRDSIGSKEKFDAWMEIKDCVKHHQRMIRIADNLDSLIGPLVFGQCMIAGVEICLNGYAVMMGDSNINLIKYILLLACGIFQLVLYCWPGEMLIQESGRISNTVYSEIPWFVLPCNQQRYLYFMIVGSRKQSQITAMGFQVMSLQKITEASL